MTRDQLFNVLHAIVAYIDDVDDERMTRELSHIFAMCDDALTHDERRKIS